MSRIFQWLRENGLSIAFFVLFVVSLAAQSVSGVASYNETLRAHGRAGIGYTEYLATGDFLDGIFVNWQAAILQLGCLIVFAEIFHQRGASHSRKSGKKPRRKKRKNVVRNSWIYRNSLSLAFGLLFAGSFAGHMIFGTLLYNQTRSLTGQPPVSLSSYLITGDFWFKMVQTWQAEFIGIALFIVLSIFLRQEGSAESKPVESSNRETGETNK